MKLSVAGLRRICALLCFCAIAFALNPYLGAQHVAIIPQAPAGGSVQVIITIVNTNFSTTVSGVLSFFNQDGTPRTVAIDGKPSGTSFQVSVPAGGSVVLNMTQGGTLTVGMAKFSSDFPAGVVVRFVLGGSQIGVLESPPLPFATLVFSTAGGNDTGLAITNPGTSPVNLSLIYTGDNGQVLETVNPAELNPLLPNAQSSKFLPEYGFTQVANRPSGTVQIVTKTGGQFSALGLLLRSDGQLSSTGVLPGASGRSALLEFQNQAYTGIWRNTTFGSEGTATLTFALNPATNLVAVIFTLGGNVFGGPASTTPTVMTGTFNPAGFNLTGQSTQFGPTNMTVNANGTWSITANSVPGSQIGTFQISGQARPDRITGNYTVTFESGGSAVGTLTLNNVGP